MLILMHGIFLMHFDIIITWRRTFTFAHWPKTTMTLQRKKWKSPINKHLISSSQKTLSNIWKNRFGLPVQSLSLRFLSNLKLSSRVAAVGWLVAAKKIVIQLKIGNQNLGVALLRRNRHRVIKAVAVDVWNLNCARIVLRKYVTHAWKRCA
jgi:hypothetical protein